MCIRDRLYDPDAPVQGNPEGDVTVVEYFDYQCPFCKRMHPILEEVVAADGNVRLVMKDWPIFGAPSVFATFVMRQFFIALPKELEEAARVDGLGRFKIFWTIALPLARPALGAVAIFTFLHSWNLYLEPIVFLSSPDLFTLPQALTQFTDAYGGAMWNVQLAAATMTAIPVLIVFIIAQRQFVEGLAHTGLKG